MKEAGSSIDLIDKSGGVTKRKSTFINLLRIKSLG